MGSGDGQAVAGLQLQCYNRTCGKKYVDNENNSSACTYHPGVPVFHDAYKGWSCCNKKSIDFTEFLNIKGCTTSFHSNEKPAEPERGQAAGNDNNAPELPTPRVMPSMQAPEAASEPRPSRDTPMNRLELKAHSMFRQALVEARQLRQNHEKNGEAGDQALDSTTDSQLKEGTPCVNKSCNRSWNPDMSDYDDCRYHPGQAVFHEGMKYWTCCTKKTSDFNAFMQQAGCSSGKHRWQTDADLNHATNKNSTSECRIDWHQTPTDVYATFYAGMCEPELSRIEASPVRLKIHIVYDCGKTTIDRDFDLDGIADIGRSEVTVTAKKVEVRLKKKSAAAWKTFAKARFGC